MPLFRPKYFGVYRSLCLAGILIVLASNQGVAADPNIETGRLLAKQWCAGCHSVSSGGPAPDVAPSFDRIANDPVYTEDRLRTWLMNPHPPMPPLEISNTQINALVAYIRSQQGSAN